MTNHYFLSEWQPVDSVAIAWPFPASDWGYCIVDADICYQGLLKALSSKVKTRVLLHPSMDAGLWRSSFSVDLNWANIDVINTIKYDDTWIRDYGPLSLTSGLLNFVFDGWGKKYLSEADNLVNKQLNNMFNARWRESSLVVEGGALEVNDQRMLLANKNCVLDTVRNPDLSIDEIERELKCVLGLSEILWIDGVELTGDDTDGHIDTVARFTKHNGIVYSAPNPLHPDAKTLSSLDSQIRAIAKQKNFKLFALPTPVIFSEYDQSLLPATYANFLYCNNTIFVPVYGIDSDEIALSVLADAFPEVELMPVRCETLLEQHGSLHCATIQIHHS